MITILPLKKNTYKVNLGKESAEQFFKQILLSKEKKKKLNIRQVRNQLYIEDLTNIQEQYMDKPVDIVYEDSYCLIANKPPYLLIHSDGIETDTLQARVNSYLKQNQWYYYAQAVHRIDYETSGLVLFCKMPLLQNYYDEQFRNHTTIKQYLLICQGIFPKKQIDIRLPLGKDRHQPNKMRVSKTGKESFTHIEKLKVINNETLLLATIHTGRKHQIRVHMAHIGYPIKNDPLYGIKKDQQALALQSFHLVFKQPLNEEVIDISLPVDPRFTPFSNKHLKNTKHTLNNKTNV